MDPLTQGLIGAAAAQSFLKSSFFKKAPLRLAGFSGFVAGLLADADIFIRSEANPMLALEYHRHFTHSLFFIPFGALIAALLVYPFLKKHHARFRAVYLWSFAGYATHALLDACTSYGTMLLWPLSDARIAWNNVAVIDPLVTLPLLIGVAGSWISHNIYWARIGLILAVAYLGFGIYEREQAEEAAYQLASARGHTPERLEVKPTLGNLLLWRSLYLHENRYYVDAVRVSPHTDPVINEGASTPRITASMLCEIASPVQCEDARKFEYFSDYYLAYSQKKPELIGDIRYALLPQSLEPLWGIKLQPEQPEDHVRFLSNRNPTRSDWDAFLLMIAGGKLK